MPGFPGGEARHELPGEEARPPPCLREREEPNVGQEGAVAGRCLAGVVVERGVEAHGADSIRAVGLVTSEPEPGQPGAV